jgi:hypothetical protein
VVARIAPEPVGINVAVAEYRARGGYADSRPAPGSLADDPLPPIPAPVPAPVPSPAIQPASQAFAAALIAERLPARAASLSEIRLRLTGNWQAPASSLRLADRRV